MSGPRKEQAGGEGPEGGHKIHDRGAYDPDSWLGRPLRGVGHLGSQGGGGLT